MTIGNRGAFSTEQLVKIVLVIVAIVVMLFVVSYFISAVAQGGENIFTVFG